MINIIIPCYNCNETLPYTLQSLKCQTKKNFFVTLVQDGGEQSIKEIYEEYKNDLQLNFIELKENRGPGFARQVGINITPPTFEYVMFLDADDLLLPASTEMLEREMKRTNCNIISSSFIGHSSVGANQIIKASNTTWLHGKIFKLKFLKDNEITFSPKIKYNEDVNFNIKAFGMTKEVGYIGDIPTVLWRDNRKSITRSDREFSKNCLPEFLVSEADAFLYLIRHLDSANKKYLLLNFCNFYFFYEKFLTYYGEDKEKVLSANNTILELFKEENFSKLLKDNKKELISILFNDNKKVLSKIDYFPKHSFFEFISMFDEKLGGELYESCTN